MKRTNKKVTPKRKVKRIPGTWLFLTIWIILLLVAGGLIVAKISRTKILANADIAYWGDKERFAVALQTLSGQELEDLKRRIDPSGGVPRAHIDWSFPTDDIALEAKLSQQDFWHSKWDANPDDGFAFKEIGRIEEKDFKQIDGKRVLKDGVPVLVPPRDRTKRRHYWALDPGSPRILDGVMDRVDDIAWLNTVALCLGIAGYWLFGRLNASKSQTISESTERAEKMRSEHANKKKSPLAEFGEMPPLGWVLFLLLAVLYIAVLMGKFAMNPTGEAGILHGYFWTHRNAFTEAIIPEVFWTQVNDGIAFTFMAVAGALFYVWAWVDWRNLWNALPDKYHLRLLHYFFYLGLLGVGLSFLVFGLYVGFTYLSSTERRDYANLTPFSDYFLHASLIWGPFALFSVFTFVRVWLTPHLRIKVIYSKILESLKVPFWLAIERVDDRTIGFGSKNAR